MVHNFIRKIASCPRAEMAEVESATGHFNALRALSNKPEFALIRVHTVAGPDVVKKLATVSKSTHSKLTCLWTSLVNCGQYKKHHFRLKKQIPMLNVQINVHIGKHAKQFAHTLHM